MHAPRNCAPYFVSLDANGSNAARLSPMSSPPSWLLTPGDQWRRLSGLGGSGSTPWAEIPLSAVPNLALVGRNREEPRVRDARALASQIRKSAKPGEPILATAHRPCSPQIQSGRPERRTLLLLSATVWGAGILPGTDSAIGNNQWVLCGLRCRSPDMEVIQPKQQARS